MTPDDLLKTIYFEDRRCASFIVDHRTARVVLEVDVLSRIQSASGQWDFYTAEDIADARVIFSGVHSVRLEPPDLIPNDAIEEIRVVDQRLGPSGVTVHHFELRLLAGDAAGVLTPVRLLLDAESVHLEDPRHPGVAQP